MVLVLADVFAQAHDLGRTGLARNVESNHLYAGSGSRFINYRPHSLDHHSILIFGNAKILWIRTVEYFSGAGGTVIGTTGIITHSIYAPDLFHEMWNIHLALHADRRVGAQQGKRRQHVFALAEGRVDGVDVFPFGVFGVKTRLKLA